MIGIETDHITGLERSVTIMLEEDDACYFEYDKGRLFMAVIVAVIPIICSSAVVIVPALVVASFVVAVVVPGVERQRLVACISCSVSIRYFR